ncbi:hypothetical protein GH754_17970 [Salinibacillus xinjiangensis]|uniref:Uncharacterized protein n=1 Tax=Salinibacillus xinjiangensis TaxID=1229268 RepID=A0A6G1XB30_9BACI|nr:hypothetical protein [Salinibacillus xinjiangensis]
MERTRNVYLCLVCGQETICALNVQEFFILIDLTSPESQSTIVEVPVGGSMRVKGTAGALGRTLRHNSFPGKLFDEALEMVE